MADRRRGRKLIVRGLGWGLCLALWTAALLTTSAMEAGKAVTPRVLHFAAAKGLHVTAYAFLTVFLSWLPPRRVRWLLLVVLSLHAAGTEFLQQYVPGRTGKVQDVLIDHAGLLLGLALTWKRWLPHRALRRESATPLSSAPAAAPAALADTSKVPTPP